MTPEKLHLALNHFTFLFPLAALIPLGIGLACKSRPACISGFIIAALGGLLTGVVMGSGEEAYERYKDGPVTSYLDAGAIEALEHHEHVAHNWAKIMYGLAGVSLLGLLVAFVRKQWLRQVTALVMLLCLASIAAGIYIADSGGEIRRPDFRKAASLAEPHEYHDHEGHEGHEH